MKNDDINNNITNINEYRENIIPDTSAYSIDNYPQTNVPNGMANGGVNFGYSLDNNVEEFVSEEFVNAYLNEINQNTPDLWGRIEAGFEVEAEDVLREKKNKAMRTKKVVGFVVAAALITIIALPVMMSGGFSDKEEATCVYEATTEAMNTESAHYEESADYVAMDAPSEGSMEDIEDENIVESETEAVLDSTEATTEMNNTLNSVTAKQLKEIEGEQTDARQIVVEGEFLFDSDSDEVSFKIKTISDNQYSEFVIDIGDKINLSNSMFVLTMDTMLVEGRITLDSVKIDKMGNITGRIIDLEEQRMYIEKEYIDK